MKNVVEKVPKSLNGLVLEVILISSSQSDLFLLASHCMALTGERKKLTQIPREIEIFSIFALLVPTSVPKQNLRFPVFCHTIC